MPLNEKPVFSLRTRLLWLAAALVAAVFAFLLYRDLSLEIPLPSSPQEGNSHMEIEEIVLERNFGGDRWRMKAPLTVREGDETVILSADIDVATASGDRWGLHAPRAHFDESMENGVLEAPEGTVEGRKFSYRWRSGKADWEGRERLWRLSEGVVVAGDTYVMEARSGILFPGGLVRLEEEVTVRWRSDASND